MCQGKLQLFSWLVILFLPVLTAYIVPVPPVLVLLFENQPWSCPALIPLRHKSNHQAATSIDCSTSPNSWTQVRHRKADRETPDRKSDRRLPAILWHLPAQFRPYL